MSDTPALDYCLRATDDWVGYGPERGSCVGFGVLCPFASLSAGQNPADIWNDPGEAYYDCALLEKRVWGEDTPCTEVQWRVRAREELTAGVVGAHFLKVKP